MKRKSSRGINRNNYWIKVLKLFSKPAALAVPLVLLAAGQGFAKWGSLLVRETGQPFQIQYLISYACLLFRGFFWVLILKNFPLIKAYSIFSLHYVIVLILGVVFFSETLSLPQVLGALILCTGVWVCGSEKNSGKRAQT